VTLAPTNTAAPTVVPATATEAPPTDTPEPTATATPAQQVISGANAAGLAFESIVELPRQPNLAAPYVLFPPDGQSVLVQTEAGLDVLNTSLELQTTHGGMQAVGLLADGRVYGKQDGGVVFLDLASGDTEAVTTPAFTSLYTVSPDGAKLAYIQDDTHLAVVDLASGTETVINIKFSDMLNMLGFSGDGAILVAWWELNYPNASYAAYSTETGRQLYEQPTNRMAPVILSDGAHIAVEPIGQSVELHSLADNSKGASVGTIVDLPDDRYFGGGFSVASSGALMVGNFAPGFEPTDPKVLIATSFETGASLSIVSVSGVWPQVFAGADGATFVVVWPDGRVTLYQADGGDVLAESTAYAVGSHPALSPDGSRVAWATFAGVDVVDWQKGDVVLEAAQPSQVTHIGRVTFSGNDTLLAETVNLTLNEFGREAWTVRLSQWDLAAGQFETSIEGLSACDATDPGTYLKCSVYQINGNSLGIIATRILAIADPEQVLFNDNQAEVFMVSSPTADSYATCMSGGDSISVKAGADPAVFLEFACQPFFYGPAGDVLYLQDGTVVDIASGAATMQLEVDAAGHAFEAGFIESMILFEPHLQSERYIGRAPEFLAGDGFIVINDRVFDAATGDLLADLPGINEVYGLTLADEGFSLMVLSNRGLERWTVVQ
jgi:hypothetical protein